ncbi:hypothetical protein CBL_02939 [Carabus blaptoides fortunei]
MCKQCGKILKTAGNTSNLKCYIESMHSSLIGHNKKKPSSQERDRGDEPELLPLTNQPNASSTSTGAHGEVTPLSQDSLPKSLDSVSKRQSLQYSLDDSFKVISSFQEDAMQTRSFLGTTIHFTEGDKLVSCTLGLIELDKNHTAEYIATELLHLLHEPTKRKTSLFLDLSSIINGIVHRHTSAPPMITAMENEILKEIKELLSPSETATRDISGDRYITISIAIPIANNIHKKLWILLRLPILHVY